MGRFLAWPPLGRVKRLAEVVRLLSPTVRSQAIGRTSYARCVPALFNASSICSRWCSLWNTTLSNSAFSVRTPVWLWTNSRWPSVS